MEPETRLNKYLAACGVASRRGCDDLILAGHVEVNGHPCLKPGTRIKEGDHVRVDGKRMTLRRSTTILFNKPRGLVCTREDEFNRDTIYALLPGSLQHLHHVGRLDVDSEGLLILTNDGDLTQQLMHPSNKVEKEYLVTSNQPYTQDHLDLLLSGVYTKEGKLSAKSLRRLSARRLAVVLDQGAKRQIRVMLDTLGYQVIKLVRVRIGSLWGGDLEVGRYVLLGPEEIAKASTNPDQPAPKSVLRDDIKSIQAAKKLARKTAVVPYSKEREKQIAKKKATRRPATKKAASWRKENEPPRRERKRY